MVNISLSTIFRFRNANKLTRQKVHSVAPQKILLQGNIIYQKCHYTALICLCLQIKQEQIIGIQHVQHIQRTPPVNHSLRIRGERVSAIACMSAEGILDVKTLKGTNDGDTFYDFVQSYLFPHLMPFDGKNPQICSSTR